MTNDVVARPRLRPRPDGLRLVVRGSRCEATSWQAVSSRRGRGGGRPEPGANGRLSTACRRCACPPSRRSRAASALRARLSSSVVVIVAVFVRLPRRRVRRRHAVRRRPAAQRLSVARRPAAARRPVHQHLLPPQPAAALQPLHRRRRAASRAVRSTRSLAVIWAAAGLATALLLLRDDASGSASGGGSRRRRLHLPRRCRRRCSTESWFFYSQLADAR